MSQTTAILADIGGTNARFSLLVDGEIAPITTYRVADYLSPVEAARAFLAGPAAGHRPQIAVMAAAGPVVNGRVSMTNAAWIVDAELIREGLELQTARVINDFEALGWALPGFGAADLVAIGAGVQGQPGPMVVMGPGTGFGLAALASDGGAEVVLVTEGGHATLPAENPREDAIIAALRARHPHVSIERALSGPGLVELYEAIAALDGAAVPRRDSAEIVAHGLAGDCATSRATLEAFCGFLGSVAGNAALTLGSLGGLFVAGGIVPRFTDFLRQSAFRARFEAKGRLAPYLARIPTAVIVHPEPAFVGLARLARRLGG
ncbi:MAG TPA: glucokinase [Acetobacteraceae bacterium]|jgi:glucokinase